MSAGNWGRISSKRFVCWFFLLLCRLQAALQLGFNGLPKKVPLDAQFQLLAALLAALGVVYTAGALRCWTEWRGPLGHRLSDSNESSGEARPYQQFVPGPHHAPAARSRRVS